VKYVRGYEARQTRIIHRFVYLTEVTAEEGRSTGKLVFEIFNLLRQRGRQDAYAPGAPPFFSTF